MCLNLSSTFLFSNSFVPTFEQSLNNVNQNKYHRISDASCLQHVCLSVVSPYSCIGSFNQSKVTINNEPKV